MRALGALILAAFVGAGSAACAAAPAGGFAASIQPGPAGSALISFGPNRTLETTVIGPIGGAMVAPMGGGAAVGMAVAMGQPHEGVPLIGYKVTRESFASDPICPGAPTAGIVVMYPETGPQKLAAIAGGAPGDPGARVCAIYSGVVNNPPLQDAYQ